MHRAFAVVLALPLAACASKVFVEGTGGSGGTSADCGPEPATLSGGCPPVWVCFDGNWIDTGGACPECPTDLPGYGDPCDIIGQQCSYDVDIPCGPSGPTLADCTASGWSLIFTVCQPPLLCPDALPAIGSDCTGFESAWSCDYYLDCGELAVQSLHCDLTTTPPAWQLLGAPACGACADAESPEACGVTSGCAWLVPGCAAGGDVPIAAGCYASSGCDVTGCGAASDSCQPFVFDPCAGEPCNACGATYWACTSPGG